MTHFVYARAGKLQIRIISRNNHPKNPFTSIPHNATSAKLQSTKRLHTKLRASLSILITINPRNSHINPLNTLNTSSFLILPLPHPKVPQLSVQPSSPTHSQSLPHAPEDPGSDSGYQCHMQDPRAQRQPELHQSHHRLDLGHCGSRYRFPRLDPRGAMGLWVWIERLGSLLGLLWKAVELDL
jgi:hypothetical protein